MSTEEDLKNAEGETEGNQPSEEPTGVDRSPAGDGVEIRAEGRERTDSEVDQGEVDAEAPQQLGYTRFVYAGYLAGAMIVGFLTAKIGHVAWYRLGQWKAELGEPKDEIIYPAAGVFGILVALY